MGTTDLQAKLHCNCGRQTVARSRDAGGSITCSCGNSIAVPKLSELRLLAGTDPYVTNPAEAIRKAQRDGKEPAGHQCLCCGSWSPILYECTAVCEQSHLKKTGGRSSFWTHAIALVVLPLFLHIFLWFRKDDPTIDRQGHDIEVNFKLPLCKLCCQSVGSPTRKSVTKQLMLKVPLLAELLNYYPRLSLKTVQLNP